MISFALVYTCLVIITLIFCATVFGLAVKNVVNDVNHINDVNDISKTNITNFTIPAIPANQPSLSNLVSIAAIMQALWLCIPILIVYLITVGLISVSDGTARMIFKVLGALILIPLNIWLLVDAVIAFASVHKGDNLLMNNTIFGMTIMAAIFCLITSVMFLGGIVYGLVRGSNKKSAL